MSSDRELSKRLSYVLRHRPDSIGVELDAAGWVELTDLVRKLQESGSDITETDMAGVVSRSDKQRFELVDGRIRAAQGHSVEVDLGLEVASAPETLWHGTVERFLDSIMSEGLQPSGRTHVHLSDSLSTARSVGSRRGKPVILTVAAAALQIDGHEFFLSSNGVWLTSHAPPTHLKVSQHE